MDDLSADDIALMHENNWLNRRVAKQCSKSVSDLTLSDFLNIEKIYYGYDKDGYPEYSERNTTDNIPKSIKFLSNLTNLRINSLSYQIDGLNELPKEIGNLINLTVLNLYFNNLRKLPDSIKNLTNLTSLHLGDNYFNELPNSIESLTNLSNLNLSFNNLTSLPKFIGNLSNLKTLNLSNNSFTLFPNELLNFENPININLNCNFIESFPEENKNLIISEETNLVPNSGKISQLFYGESIPIGLTCSSLNELNNIINNIDYFKSNIWIFTFFPSGRLNKNIPLKAIPIDNSLFDSNGNAIKTGDTYFYIKLKDISDSNPYGYIQKTYNSVVNSTIVNFDAYVKIPVHIVQRNTSVSLKVDEELPIENILEESLKTSDVSNITEEAENTTIQSLDENIISNEGKALSVGRTQAVLVTPNYGLITADVDVADNSTSEKTLNVKFTQPNTMSLTIDPNEIDFGEVNGLTDSSEKTVIASVNSSLPYDLSIKSLNENLTSENGKTIPISKLNVKGEGEYTNIGTTDNIIYTNQPNTNGEEVTHPMNFKLSEMTGYTKGEYATNLRVTATQK